METDIGATLNFIGSAFARILFFVCLWVLMGCSSTSKKSQEVLYGPPGGGPAEVVGQSPQQATIDHYGPQLPAKKAITLVLSPGMARAFAHAGVLKALQQNDIPVATVVGVEMGALIGALYASTKTINEFEWQLLRFKNEIFEPSSSHLSKFFKKDGFPRGFESALEKGFGAKTAEGSKCGLKIGVIADAQKPFTLLSNGKLSELVGESMVTPVTHPTQRIPAVEEPFPLSEIRGQGPIVLVDVLAEPAKSSEEKEETYARALSSAWTRAQGDMGYADLVLRPAVSQMRFFDFSQRTTASYQGVRVVLDHLTELKALIGSEAPKAP